MSKWVGQIGFGISKETGLDIWTTEIVERKYKGEILRNRYRNQNSSSINDNLVLSVRLKILSDSFLKENSPAIKYVEIAGAKWKVSSIECEYPNMILEVGEVYNQR